MPGKFLWLLDNGHGEATPGKRSPKLPDGRQFFEYEFNRDIVKRLVARLDAAGFSYHVLVPEVEGDIELKERVRRANSMASALPKLYVSIHSNAQSDDWGTASGIETFHYTGSEKSKKLATVFQEKIMASVPWKNRGVKTAEFYVIKNTSMPAVLTENGFFTNQEECIKLLSDEWREKIAEGHFQAIQQVEAAGTGFFG